MAATRIKMHDDLIQKTFHRFDVDNSGFITRENLKQVLGDVFKEEEVDSIMADLDTSHDGQISYEEFFEYITHPEAHSNHHDIAAAVVDHHVSQSEDPEEIAVSEHVAHSVQYGSSPWDGRQRGAACLRTAYWEPT
ncbi:unnamed protein product [Prorocentrum cordatum]|uniref:EF-hand domain-containing protein n=1 Tax=Prorocentrum cordatum TaxID=2364126 RepID=A0ABN9YBB0_9DINO|nr:unnamed protein product [Polarella glacialis]